MVLCIGALRWGGGSSTNKWIWFLVILITSFKEASHHTYHCYWIACYQGNSGVCIGAPNLGRGEKFNKQANLIPCHIDHFFQEESHHTYQCYTELPVTKATFTLSRGSRLDRDSFQLSASSDLNLQSQIYKVCLQEITKCSKKNNYEKKLSIFIFLISFHFI